MPKSHLPRKGGIHPNSWGSSRASSVGSGESDRIRSLQDEIERLKRELEQNKHAPEPAVEGGLSQRLLWVALALCGFAIVFAVMAVQLHG